LSLDFRRKPPLKTPQTDPTPIFEHFRGSYGSALLTAAIAHFDVFGRLARRPCPLAELQAQLGLADRPAHVLVTALLAMGLVEQDGQQNGEGTLRLSPLAAEHLAPGGEFDVGDYVGLAASAPFVTEMVELLKTNRPAGSDGEGPGAAFIYRQGVASAMEEEQLARHFTLALAGRAKNVAPHLAAAAPLEGAKTLLDVGGGTGVYSIAYLQTHPELKAIVLDRPEVLKTADEFARKYGVSDRLQLLPGDMFADPLPSADAVLLSNILHDWDAPQCQQLVDRCAAALSAGGRLLIHDVLLDDDLGGPLPIALYSAALFSLTEGRAYSGREFRGWLDAAGLAVRSPVPTLVHCHVIVGEKT